ncbi:hypothetical protein BH11MYX1_BH11MYX1_17810 [soil metagenome]
MPGTRASSPPLGYHLPVAATETLRVVLDAGNATRRLDELSTARVILKVAEQVHSSQQKAGAGKAIGPLTPSSVTIETATGAVKLGLAEPSAFGYAAPEQLGEAEATHEGDRRSDVWSLGVVMWEALTHATLFEGGDDDAIKAAVRQQRIDPPATLNANIPAELSAICMRALARNPADRYQSAKVMGAELEAVLDDAGYGDTDDKIREYMATLGQPKREPKITTPPMVATPAQGVGVVTPEITQPTPPPEMLPAPPGNGFSTSPGMVIPRGDQAPSKSPALPITVSRSANGTQPPPIGDPSPMSPTSFLKPTTTGSPAGTLPSILRASVPKPPTTPPPVVEAKKAGTNLASALANAAAPAKQDRSVISTMVSAAIPMPQTPQLPKPPVLPPPTPAQTAPGFHSDQIAKAADANPAVVLEAPPVVVAEIPSLVSAPMLSEKRPDPTPMAEVKKRAGTNPDPAAVVALPPVRDSQGVLGGWGWGTDSHSSIKAYDSSTDDDDLPTERASKKILLYVIGGGFGVVAIIIVLAFAFGGGEHPAPKQQAKMTGSGSAEIAYGSGVAYGSATGDPTGGSGVAAAAGSGADAVAIGSAATAGMDAAAAGSADPGSAVAAVGSAAAVVAPPPPPAPVPADAASVVAVAPLPKPMPPTPIEKPKPAHPVVVAKAIEKKPEKKPEPPHHAEKPKPIHVAEGPSVAAKADAEASYRQGVQQFARGDTNGALTSLRTAVASNPGYAPTWRGLGLVFEKMGERDQAKAAFRRYLQLSPGASDGDQVRNRMEKL